MEPIYEDNHIIVVSKRSGEIVQGDKTGDEPLAETVKRYIKEMHHKPGNVFLGVVHRLDRPVSGLVLFAKTSKALSRLNDMFRTGKVEKRYWALVEQRPPEDSGELRNWLIRNEKQNKSYVSTTERAGAKEAHLSYKLIGRTERYWLVEVELHTGRHHQIRCQLSSIGCPIRGDLKYGAKRSLPDGSISLISRYMSFVHPVSKQLISLEAPLPDDKIWREIKPIEH